MVHKGTTLRKFQPAAGRNFCWVLCCECLFSMVKSTENDPKTLKIFRLRRGMGGWCFNMYSEAVFNNYYLFWRQHFCWKIFFKLISKLFLSLKRMKMVLERAAGAKKLGFGGSKIGKFWVFTPPLFGTCLRTRGGGKNSRDWVDPCCHPHQISSWTFSDGRDWFKNMLSRQEITQRIC